jgi:signal transduction histidine kinase
MERGAGSLFLPSSVPLAALVCLGLSAQLLFQRELYAEAGALEIILTWLRGVRDVALIAASILAALFATSRVPARYRWQRAALFVVAIFAGAAVGEALVLCVRWGEWSPAFIDAAVTRAWRWAPISGLAAAILVLRQRASRTAAALHQNEITRMQLERQRTLVRLQILQSQIEPHFLFNTLATIRRLYQTDPARGRKTLSQFIHYIRFALPGMRASETTLGNELELITAYLDVLRVRMGTRLEVEIDVPAALRTRRIPPLSLATLVENAVKHGLEALPEGGRLSIRASIERDRLILCVADTGQGMTAAAGGTGMGLANLRMRLRALYGQDAELVLAPNRPRGLAATVHIPRMHAQQGIVDAPA